MKVRALLAIALAAAACGRQEPAAREAPPPAPKAPHQEARALLEQGQLDAALAKLEAEPQDADNFFYQGRAWAKKAETAPLPTPPPAPSPLSRGATPPPAPELKAEEVRALELLEQAVAAKPDHARAQLAIADLLAPHAMRWYEQEGAARKKVPLRAGKARATPAPLPPPVPDYRPERVVQAYQLALQADPASKASAESFVKFCLRVGRLEDGDAALRELIKRDKESPDPLIRYGDFLMNDRKDPEAAIEQYRQALIWRADDDVTRGKLADIYISMGLQHFAQREYGVAEARFKEAEKYVTDKNSPRGLKVQDHLGRLKDIRRPSQN